MLPPAPAAFTPHYIVADGPQSSRFPASDPSFEQHQELSPFRQTQKEEEEQFYKTFPAARPSPWSMVSMPQSSPFQGFAFSYSSHPMTKAWPSECPAESLSHWNLSGPHPAPARTFAELSQQPTYLMWNSSLLPQRTHFDYTRHRQQSYESPEPSSSGTEPPATPMYSRYAESLYDSPNPQLASPLPQQKVFFTGTFDARACSYDSTLPAQDYYHRHHVEEPLMDHLPSPTSPALDNYSIASSPYDTCGMVHPPASSPTIPYLGPNHELIPINTVSRKSRRHTPIPETLNSRSFLYRLAGSSQTPVPSGPRTPASSEDKKQPTLACFFCRGRKIACGVPDADNPDRTCNQCLRRKLKCVYPKESRRGMRKKKTCDDAAESASVTPK